MLYSKVCDIYLLELIFYLRAFLQWITHSLDSLYCPLKASWFSSTFPEEYPCPLTKSVHLQHFNNVRSKLKKCMVPEDPDYFVLTKWWSMEMQWECGPTIVHTVCERKRNLTQESSEKILSSMWESNPWHYNLSLITSELLQTPRWTGLKFNQNKTSHGELFWYTTTKINKKLLYKTCWSINCPCIG